MEKWPVSTIKVRAGRFKTAQAMEPRSAEPRHYVIDGLSQNPNRFRNSQLVEKEQITLSIQNVIDDDLMHEIAIE